jgi:hypothetical protein
MARMKSAYKSLVGKSEEKRPLGRSRHRWEDNIKMELKEIGCENENWILIAQNRTGGRLL